MKSLNLYTTPPGDSAVVERIQVLSIVPLSGLSGTLLGTLVPGHRHILALLVINNVIMHDVRIGLVSR